jgi:uncharacterized protein YkwD
MRRRLGISLALGLTAGGLGWMALAAAEIEPTRNENRAELAQPDRSTRLHTMPPEDFGKLPEAGHELDFEHLDHRLLAAAIFHETNRRRAEHKLPALEPMPGLREAARIQARGMRKEEVVSHTHPDESKKTLSDRLDLLGIKGRFFAENVAMTFGLRYESGEPFYTRREDGRQIPSIEPDGPPIPPHTYQSFAADLLDQWMNSPGHRENILSEDARMLGTWALHDRSPEGMDSLYSVQVFFAPFDG